MAALMITAGKPRIPIAIRLAFLGVTAMVVLPGCGDEPGGDQPPPTTNKASTKPSTKPATSKPASTAPASIPAGMMALDLGLTVDAVTRATPGNPEGVKPPHLREEVKREDFIVPEGLENLALYKEVTAGVDEPNLGDLDQVTDGIKKSGDFDFVEMGEGAHWIRIDLAEVRTVYAIAIWHFYKNATIYNDVIVQVADDPDFTKNVRTLFNNDHDNSAKLGKGADGAFYTRWWGELVDARGPDGKGTRARYVRIHTSEGMEGEWVRFVEVDVYGR
jgi:hypothetical protein